MNKVLTLKNPFGGQIDDSMREQGRLIDATFMEALETGHSEFITHWTGIVGDMTVAEWAEVDDYTFESSTNTMWYVRYREYKDGHHSAIYRDRYQLTDELIIKLKEEYRRIYGS